MTCRKHQIEISMAAILFSICMSASASIKIIYDTVPENVDQNYALSVDGTMKTMTHIGEMPEALPGIYSIGVGKPLYSAFDELIPVDWKVYVNHALEDDIPISWDSKGENWLATLYAIGMTYELSFDVNWTQRWVLVNKSALRYRYGNKNEPTVSIESEPLSPGKKGVIVIEGKRLTVRRAERKDFK